MLHRKNSSNLEILEANAPEAIRAFWAFDKAAMSAGVTHKGPNALAVAYTAQCPYCIGRHARHSHHHGVKRPGKRTA